MDIRNFFKPKTSPAAPAKKRRIEDDDDEDVIPASLNVDIINKKKKTNESQKSSKSKSKPALKEVKANDLFGNGPIKRSEPIVKKPEPKSKKNTETGIHSDEEFEKSLLEIDGLDEVKPTENNDDKNNQINDLEPSSSKEVRDKEDKKKKSKHSLSIQAEKKESSKMSSSMKEMAASHSETKKNVDNLKKEIKDSNKRKFEEFIENDVIKAEESDKKSKKTKADDSNYNKLGHEPKNNHDIVENHDITMDDSIIEDEGDLSMHKKKKHNKSLNETVLTDEERHERKRHSAALYQKYLNRTGPKHLGTKEIPQGAENCLKDCAFLLTGVLDSFEREEIEETIKKYGGCIKSGISKKVTHVLAGEDAGPAKMAKAEELGIKILGEDGFIKLIQNSNQKSKHETHSKDKTKNHDKKTNKNKSMNGDTKSEKKHISPIEKKQIKKEKSSDNVKEDKKQVKKEKSNENLKEIKKEKSSYNLKAKESKSEVNKDKSDKNHEKEAKINKEDEQIIKVNGLTKIQNKSDSGASSSSSINLANNVSIGAANATMWVEKYKPQNLKGIIGQTGEASNVKKLVNWLTKWYVNRKAKHPKPSPWAKNDDGGYYKAALLSGPPGVGKTTTVSLVCKELGFDMVEFNASDTRNKTLIREQIGELLTTTSLSAYAKGDTGKQAVTKKHVLVMDEVDGMSGNEDRGGLQELIGLIKSASVPIICMCNDRNSQKMRSLVNYCYDLRFNRPKVEQIKAAMRSICCKENIKVPPDVLGQLIISANQDVRQTLNLLSMWAVDPSRMEAAALSKDASVAKKDVKLGPWEAIRKVFSAEDHKTMSINDKSDLFFYDYSLSPLFVQENYLQVQPHCPKGQILDRISKAAESIAIGDTVEKRIRSAQAWSLLPMQAMYSSVIPGHHLSGHVAGQIQFPGWLGKNSRASKMQRLCQEIHAHTRLSTTGSKSSIFLDYASHLRDAILNPLIIEKSDGVERSLEVLESYHLLRDDLDSLTELSLWPGAKNPAVLVDPKVKASMTRTYNKKVSALPYAPGAIKRGKQRDDDGYDDNDEVEEDADSDPENDALIKKKKARETEKASDKPSTSKGKSTKGKSSKEKKK